MGYQEGIVYFIDILGSKNITDFNTKLKINSAFHDILEKNQAENTVLNHTIYERHIFVFSDCAYIIYYYKDNVPEAKKHLVELLGTSLRNTSFVILKLLYYHVLCRGGIAVGDVYFENDRNLAFGPAMECASSLESKCAIYPRILIEKEWAKKYLTMEINYYKNMAEDYSNSFVEKYQKALGHIVIQDYDGNYHLNYFSPMKQGVLYSEISNFKEYYTDLLKFSANTISQYTEKLDKAKNDIEKKEAQKIVDKHNWFIKYLKDSEPPKYNNPVFVMGYKPMTSVTELYQDIGNTFSWFYGA
jgi:hypothetical protein